MDERERVGAIKWRLAAPLVIAVAFSVGFLIVVSHVDEAASAAHARESVDLVRGAFVDTHGHPLAVTVLAGGKSRRRYSLPSLVSVLGYQTPAPSWTGLEKRYDSLLEGSSAREDWRTFFLHLRGQSVRGGRVRLTIDRAVQNAADKALGRGKGAVVAIDPRTGGVLAMANKPYCPPWQMSTTAGQKSCRSNPDRPLQDRALQILLPPGSAFKVVTLSAAFDTGKFSLRSTLSGSAAFGPSPYFDNVTYPSNVLRTDLTQLTLAQALAFSDNFAFAHIGLTLGGPTLLKYAHRFYLDERIPFDFPVARSWIANGKAHPSAAEVAQSSFGAEVDRVTPMQMAMVAAGVANGGRLMAPHLVEALEDGTGKIVHRYKVYSLRRVMTGRAAREVTDGMVFVVEHGSGYRAQIAGIRVAGKTGTAASHAYYPHAWFIAFAPARHPVVAVAVLHEYSGEAFKYAAPLARKVLVAALKERGFKVR